MSYYLVSFLCKTRVTDDLGHGSVYCIADENGCIRLDIVEIAIKHHIAKNEFKTIKLDRKKIVVRFSRITPTTRENYEDWVGSMDSAISIIWDKKVGQDND